MREPGPRAKEVPTPSSALPASPGAMRGALCHPGRATDGAQRDPRWGPGAGGLGAKGLLPHRPPHSPWEGALGEREQCPGPCGGGSWNLPSWGDPRPPRKTLQLSRQLKDQAVEAQACYSLGNTYTLLQDYERAAEYHLRHLLIAQELADRCVRRGCAPPRPHRGAAIAPQAPGLNSKLITVA